MAYEKYTWQNGEVITANKLNHMEDGIASTSGGSGDVLESITYSELIAKRNGGTLTPGMQYRITDYVCTTTQEDTRAVSHPFDIIVVADDESTLNENARACLHGDDNVVLYDGDIVIGNPGSGENYIETPLQVALYSCPSSITVTYDGIEYVLPFSEDGSFVGYGDAEDEEFKHFPMFIMMLGDNTLMITPDNATGTHTFKIEYDNSDYYVNCNLEAWELKYCIDNDAGRFEWADVTNGKGIIYWLKDERENECSYDFKQIQFKRYPITECSIDNLVGQLTTLEHGGAITEIDTDNPVWCYTFGIMSDASIMEMSDNGCSVFNNIIHSFHIYKNFEEHGKKYIRSLNNIVFSSNCTENVFESGCYSNTFGANCNSNKFGTNCSYNTFGESCGNNIFGIACTSNTFGEDCGNNIFGNSCSDNVLAGTLCVGNVFGDECMLITLGKICRYNTFSTECSNITLQESCQRNVFGKMCRSIRLGSTCTSNIFGSDCFSDTLGNYCSNNTFGNKCEFVNYPGGESAFNANQYYHLLDGTSGEHGSPITITGTNGNNYVTYVGKNTSGTVKTWVPADLAQ